MLDLLPVDVGPAQQVALLDGGAREAVPVVEADGGGGGDDLDGEGAAAVRAGAFGHGPQQARAHALAARGGAGGHLDDAGAGLLALLEEDEARVADEVAVPVAVHEEEPPVAGEGAREVVVEAVRAPARLARHVRGGHVVEHRAPVAEVVGGHLAGSELLQGHLLSLPEIVTERNPWLTECSDSGSRVRRCSSCRIRRRGRRPSGRSPRGGCSCARRRTSRRGW